MTEKYCVKCGKKFMAIGRQVICPSCRAAAEEESKRAAVERAKRASWNGESVPVRISGRASTVIRRYGAANGLPFAQALDELLKASTFFQSAGKAWDDITPYRSHRRDKHATEDTNKPQEAPQDMQTSKQAADKQDKQDKPVKPVKQAAKATSKASASKTAAGKAGKKA